MPNDNDDIQAEEEDTTLKVQVVNQKEIKKAYSVYDSYEDENYDDHQITDKEIKEFEDNK